MVKKRAPGTCQPFVEYSLIEGWGLPVMRTDALQPALIRLQPDRRWRKVFEIARRVEVQIKLGIAEREAELGESLAEKQF